jgi:type III restriction enzyme
METRWLPGVNHLRRYGRWAFAEFTDVFAMQQDFADAVQAQLNTVVEKACQKGTL